MVYGQVIASEGEQKSSKALKEAADVLATSPAALQLRYLQVRSRKQWIEMLPLVLSRGMKKLL